MSDAPTTDVEMKKVHARRRPRLIPVMLAGLAAVFLLRVYLDRRKTSDNLKYADEHEAMVNLDKLLQAAPQTERLALSLRYLDSESPGMRYAALDSLEQTNAAGIADRVEHMFLDSSAEVRKHAMDLLPALDSHRGYRLLLAGLQDEDAWVRDHAIFLLGSNYKRPHSFVDRTAVPILMKSMTDSDPNIAPLAMPVLKKFTGNTWRYSILDSEDKKQKVKAEWQNWWAANSSKWALDSQPAIGPISPTRADPAPEFSVRDIDGARFSNQSLKGKVVLLNFWGSWCAPCKGEVPDLVRLNNEYQNRGLQILGIAEKETGVDSLRNYCRLHGIQYKQVMDPTSMERVFGDIDEVPVSVLIDKDGLIRRRWDGERDFDTFRLAVERLLRE